MEITLKDYLKTYQVISQIMEDNNKIMDNSFRHVKSWLSNKICDELKEGDIL